MDETVVLLPIGSVEEHGVLPPDTDTLIARAFCELVRTQCDALVDEPIADGFCPTTCKLAGTKTDRFADVFRRVSLRVESLIAQGRRCIILVNIHGGNDSVLTALVQDIYVIHGLGLFYVNPYRAFAEELDATCFGRNDNSFKECCLLLGSLEILTLPPVSGPGADEHRSHDALLGRLRQIGVVGFSYRSPADHVAWRAGASARAGRMYLQGCADRVAPAIEDFIAYTEGERAENA